MASLFGTTISPPPARSGTATESARPGITSPLQTLTERLSERVRQTPGATAYLRLAGDGTSAAHWQPITWIEVANRVARLAAQFRALGIRPGDRVAIMLPSIPEWEYCQFATLAVGAVVVGLDAHDARHNLRHILELTTPRALIVPDADKLAFIEDVWGRIEIPIVATQSDNSSAAHWLQALLNTPCADEERPFVAGPDDTATIVFTSGSSGRPKGIAYSHRQVVLACNALLQHFPTVRDEARLVCWMPLSNLFQRVLNLFAVVSGAQTYFVDRPDQIVRLLPGIRPTLFVGVPRFFEKLHDGINAQIDRQPGPLRAVVKAAWSVGERLAAARRAGRDAPLWCRALAPVANRLLGRVRALMGPDLRFMVSGSAPLPRWLIERFDGLGWLLLEAYGTTENVVPLAINTPESCRFGSVGRLLPENEFCIAEDGELLIRGPGVFSGHYVGGNDGDGPLDADGYLHTGDYARLDADGYLWLEGRKSDVFKTSTGRRVAPVPIETELKKIDYVEHAIVTGRDRPYPLALLIVDPQHPITRQLHDPATLALIARDAEAACRELADHQRPGVLVVSRQALSISGGQLTANLKLRRRAIETHFKAQIDDAYLKPRGERPPGAPLRTIVIPTP